MFSWKHAKFWGLLRKGCLSHSAGEQAPCRRLRSCAGEGLQSASLVAAKVASGCSCLYTIPVEDAVQVHAPKCLDCPSTGTSCMGMPRVDSQQLTLTRTACIAQAGLTCMACCAWHAGTQQVGRPLGESPCSCRQRHFCKLGAGSMHALHVDCLGTSFCACKSTRTLCISSAGGTASLYINTSQSASNACLKSMVASAPASP